MKLLILTVLAILVGIEGMAIDDSTIRDMPFVTNPEYCLECHTKTETQSFENKTARSCSTYCVTCHQDLGAHHQVDRYLTGPVPKEIDLMNHKVACITCHDLETQRLDRQSWKAESLFERAFQSKNVYKTYFLIERNNTGQLCKKCH